MWAHLTAGCAVEVVDVAVNANAGLSEGFLAEYRKVATSGVAPNLRFLWHGCGPGVLQTVLQSGE